MTKNSIKMNGMSHPNGEKPKKDPLPLLSLTMVSSLDTPGRIPYVKPDGSVKSTQVINGHVNGGFEADGGVKDNNNSAFNKSVYLDLPDGGAGDDAKKTAPVHKEESVFTFILQVIIPFMIAGCGNVAAGVILNKVQHWEVFKDATQLLILVPALLGLKGDVEMTLASRLSTQSNLGNMDESKNRKSLVIGNMALVQCQASAVGFIAAILAMVMGLTSTSVFNFDHALLVSASSVATANIANLILGSAMSVVVILSRKFKINPDNIATPIAASMGDIITMSLLAGISRSLHIHMKGYGYWLPAVVLGVFLLFTPLWGIIARKNQHTKSIVFTGWIPITIAMIIASGGGWILESALKDFDGMAVFQPVVSGIGGNLVAIQSSRMATYLHRVSTKGVFPDTDPKVCIFPWGTFFSRSPHAKMARVLLLLAGPSHVIFVFIIRLVEGGSVVISAVFLTVYIAFALLQVSLLLYIAYVMIQWLWKMKLDPDNNAIPVLTAFGDLLGPALLSIAFLILKELGDPNALTKVDNDEVSTMSNVTTIMSTIVT